MRKPSVIFFNRVYPPVRGATGRLLRDLAQAFLKAGWDVTVVSSAPVSRDEYDGKIRVVRVKAPRGVRRKIGFYIKIWLKMFWAGLVLPRHDLIVTMTDPPLFVMAGQWLRRIKKTSHIHWCQDLFPDLFPALGVKFSAKKMAPLKRWSRRAMKRADKVVVIGRCMGNFFAERWAGRRANYGDSQLAGS